jgi:hypothetical protein
VAGLPSKSMALATTPGAGDAPGVVARSDVDGVPGDAGQDGGPVVGHDGGHGGITASVRTVARSLTALPIAGTLHSSTRGPGGRPVGEYPALPSRLKTKPLRAASGRKLTRLALARSGDTGHLRRARSTRQSTANSSGQGPLIHNRKDQRPLPGGQHGWRINKAHRWRGWADPDVGMALSLEEELEGVRDGHDFGKRRRDLDRDG